MTEPTKIGHICTQNLALFLDFNLQYLMMFTSYDNEIFMPSSHINKKASKVYRTWKSYTQTKKSTIFWACMCNLCRYAWFSQAQAQLWNISYRMLCLISQIHTIDRKQEVPQMASSELFTWMVGLIFKML